MVMADNFSAATEKSTFAGISNLYFVRWSDHNTKPGLRWPDTVP